jgi:hypothetical protein
MIIDNIDYYCHNCKSKLHISTGNFAANRPCKTLSCYKCLGHRITFEDNKLYDYELPFGEYKLLSSIWFQDTRLITYIRDDRYKEHVRKPLTIYQRNNFLDINPLTNIDELKHFVEKLIKLQTFA